MKIDLRAKSFAGRQVLGSIQFELAPGERLAITGPSGIGKTTLLRIIGGLDDDFDGEVDTPLRTGFVFQTPSLLPWRTALDNLLIPTRCEASVATDMLQAVGLAGLATAYPRQLSLGQQRRLALGRAFAAEPDLLLLDEAFASLDSENKAAILSLTDDLAAARNVRLILATHDLDEISQLCSRHLRLDGHPAVLKHEDSGTY